MEEFAYDYYEEQFPLEPRVSSFFGKGVFESTVLNTTDNRYHETDGSTYYDSPNKICLRQFFNIMLEPSALMLNLHFKKPGHTHRHLITCSETNTEDCVLICYVIDESGS
jgi:hypothetical protein